MKRVPLEVVYSEFALNPETGELFRFTRGVLSIAGCLTDQGYREAVCGGERIKTHRIIFAIANRRWPEGEVDHINGDRSDNRPCNLREATHAQNQRNAAGSRNVTSGLKGAYFDKRRGTWYSRIMVDKKDKHLGIFPDARSAHLAYLAAAKELHGDFARLA